MGKFNRVAASLAIVVITALTGRAEPVDGRSAPQRESKLATVEEMIASRTDAWGDAAMRQPNGASYEFFKDLLPPVRWVNAEFRHYPIVLSAPRAPEKVRLISNGSVVNALGGKQRMWFDHGVPVKFFVGNPAEAFGQDLSRLETPAYLEGYLPIVVIRYKSGSVGYREEVFAPVDQRLSALGAAMVRFSITDADSGNGRVEARIGSQPGVRVQQSHVLNEQGQSLVAFDNAWKWDAGRGALIADLHADKTAELLVFSKPADETLSITKPIYDEAKIQCSRAWKDLLGKGVRLETPEPIVNDAWRSLVIGNLMVAVGDLPHYSAGNAYGPSSSSPRHLYEAECGDTLRSLMLFGQTDVGPPMLKPMLEFPRKDTRFHVAGQKLQLLANFYWPTHDTATVRTYEPLWRQAENLILTSREKDSGLLPKDNYAGDIHTQVYSLNSNANCWRGLRDLAAVLEDMGSNDEANKLREQAAEYRKAILKAVDESVRRDSKPPYIPIGLLSDEKAPDPLTSTQLGSYYDLICPYIIGSEIFGQGSERENCLLGYLQRHGGIAMGMMRTKPVQGQFKGGDGCVPLYALRYNLALERRDEREKALVGFYGQLAQGMTRGTFIGGEGNRFQLGADANGRGFYLPPNSTSNAAWLMMLRYLLVQDWDLDQDGKPDTLRLMYGVPRRWLEDGKQIRFESAPTAFGRVSVHAQSKLSDGFVEVQVKPPEQPARSMLLRAPVPAGWRVESVSVDGKAATLLGGDSVELSGQTDPCVVKFAVKSSRDGD